MSQNNVHNNNDEHQSGDDDNNDNDSVDNNNDCDIGDDKTNNYCEIVDSMKWIASVNTHDNVTNQYEER